RALERDVAVLRVAGVGDGPEHGQRVGDVREDEVPVGGLGVLLPQQLGELGVVVGRVLDGLLEDRRVGGDAADAGFHLALELARREELALQVVEPRALAEALVQLVELRHDGGPPSAASRTAGSPTTATLPMPRQTS